MVASFSPPLEASSAQTAKDDRFDRAEGGGGATVPGMAQVSDGFRRPGVLTQDGSIAFTVATLPRAMTPDRGPQAHRQLDRRDRFTRPFWRLVPQRRN